ncbi:MAG TPA: LLM class flavin-dependent oxidoreductase [Acidimicrobiales bacterium]|nr:LLM class flavin-dependent oxidoreductase [Acidimicrobiales bacterium]
MKIVRFNQVQPGVEPHEMSSRYQATLDMAAYADEHGFDAVTLEEHHGADNGWSPSPLVTAGLIFGRCPRIPISISALLVPLHDPLRIAEDIAVLDLASRGRLSVIAGIGYRPQEYAQHGKRWADRGKLMDEALDVMLKAWTGEPFEYRGTTVKVTPKPLTQPHPFVMVGGTSRPAARRAARLGLPLSPAANLPELEAYYYEQCKEEGTQGFCAMPMAGLSLVFVHEDPDRAWDELG